MPKDILELMLCCGSSREYCECPNVERLSFIEADLQMAEMGIKAYKDDTACLSCIFYESSMCRPYRRFLNSFMNEHHDDIDEQTISVCEDYTDVEAGQKQGIL